MEISVAQLIYSNVPKEQSPHKKRGYQTLFYTHSALTRSEVLTIEERSQYYHQEDNPVKWQGYMVGDKTIIARTIPLLERDEFGRKGRYLTHALILRPDQMEALANAHCGLWQPHWFMGDLESAYADGNMRTGNIDLLTIEVDYQWQHRASKQASQIDPETLKRWLHTFWEVETLTGENQPLALNGTSQRQLEILQAITLLTHPNKRPAYTFDTQSFDCSWRPRDFWIQGGITSALAIDIEQLQVTDLPSSSNLSLYERWVLSYVERRSISRLFSEQADALKVDAVFKGANQHLNDIDPDFGRKMVGLNRQAVAARVLEGMPFALSDETSQRFSSIIEPTVWRHLCWVVQNPAPSEIARFVQDWIVGTLKRSLPQEDFKTLNEFAQQTQDAVLQTLLTIQSGNFKHLQDQLSQLAPHDYNAVVYSALNAGAIDVATAFAFPHMEMWAVHFGDRLDPEKLPVILKQIQKDESCNADLLVPLVEKLPTESNQKWAKWLRKYKGQAPKLQQALEPFRKPTIRERLGW